MKQCSIDSCNERYSSKGYCKVHYARMKRNGNIELTREMHGLRKLPEYRTWAHVKDRTLNPNDRFYHRYGGRGITMYRPWQRSFKTFYEYVGEKPSPKHSLDRINNDGNYEPGNVRWATMNQQAVNRKGNVLNPGVNYVKENGLWTAFLTVNRKMVLRKYFRNYDDALAARKEAEQKYLHNNE